MDILYFYYHFKENGEFSNFYEAPFYDDNGLFFPTSEHYYQYYKFTQTNLKVAKQIRTAKRPADAYRLSRQFRDDVRIDWDTIKIDVMRRAIYYKFTQNPHLKEKLLLSDSRILAENSPRDYFWGLGMDKSGKNMLGKLLMELRECLKGQQ